MLPFRFAVHSSVAPTMAAWRDHARLAEGFGYSALYVTDHFDDQFGPLARQPWPPRRPLRYR